MLARPIAPLALLALAATALHAQAPVLLRLGGAVGRPVHRRVVVTASAVGPGARVERRDSLRMLTRVVSYHTLTLDSIRGDTLAFTVRVDSTLVDSPGEPELATMLKSASTRVPRAVTLRMDPRGHLFGSAPAEGEAVGALPGATGGASDMGPGVLLPAAAVVPGDTWTDTVPLPLPEAAGGAIGMRVESRLERIESRGTAGTAVVSARGRIPLRLGGVEADIPFAAVYHLDVGAQRITGSAAVAAVTMRTQVGDVTTRSEMTEADLGTEPPPVPDLGQPGTVDLRSVPELSASEAPGGGAPPDSADPVGVELSPAPGRFSVIRLGAPAEGRLNALLAEHVRRARAAGRRPFAEFDAAWCGPCQSLERFLGNGRMVEAFAGTYIVRIDLDSWQAHLAGTGFDVQAIPAFFELGDDGRPTGRRIDGGAWGEDIPVNMAPPLKAFFRGASGPPR